MSRIGSAGGAKILFILFQPLVALPVGKVEARNNEVEINLLPVLPMDGGWVFHTLIFSRHYLLDAAFRVVAVIALVLLGMVTHTKILMYLGIPMLLGIPMAYRMARVVTTLRQRGVPPSSADDQTIPTETAQTIIAELKQKLPQVHTTKMVAEQTMQIFETLNARPPGWLATAGLLFVHFVSLAMAVVFAFVLFIGQRGDLAGMLAAAMQVPKHKLACGSISVWRGKQVLEISSGSQNTLIATFPKSSAAGKAFQSLTNQLPAGAVLKTYGETLLLSLPVEDDAARRQWLAELQQQTKEVFVDNTNFSNCRIQVEASERFHRRVAEKLQAVKSRSVLESLTAWLRGAMLSWRIALPASAVVIALFALVALRHHPAFFSPASPTVQVVPESSPGSDLAPTIANYQMIAYQSLDKLDELLTRQGNKRLPPVPVYTVLGFEPANASF